MAPVPIHNMLMHPMFCRLVGFGSSVVGLLCYALSSSFKHLFGEWNLLKIFLYILLSFIIGGIMLFAEKRNLSKSFLLKGHVEFLVLMLTSVYSFFYDKAENGKPDILSLISWVAFALMSLCMSRQIDLGIEVDLLKFFLQYLTIQLMKIKLMLAFVGAAFSYSFIILRSYLEAQPEEPQPMIRIIIDSYPTAVDIDTTNREETVADADSACSSDYSNHPQQFQSSQIRKVEDENVGTSAPGSKTVENLTLKAQLQKFGLEGTTKHLKEAIAIAGEGTAKLKAAKEEFKSLTAQLKDITERLPSELLVISLVPMNSTMLLFIDYIFELLA